MRVFSGAAAFFSKFRKRAEAHGLIYFLYELSGLINYPRNGFPRYGVDKFMEDISREVAAGALLLDAGAGHRPYKDLLRHTAYQSCDFIPVLEEVGGDNGIDHTFYCDLESIPKESGTYNVIICNQVLEHMKRPGKAIAEFYRVLKPGGKLYITVPQCFGVHMAPHNYFNFLDAGLKFLLEEAGFRTILIQPLGGIYWLLGKVTEKAYACLLAHVRPSLRGLFFPLHLCIRLGMLPLFIILFYFDRLDMDRGWTLGYGCCCVKPFSGETLG